MKNGSKSESIIYLDHAAITPVRPEVILAMERVMREAWGNSSSLHSVGRTAQVELDQAREKVARLFGAQVSEVVFTSGGTESNALALEGAVRARGVNGAHLISQPTEHVSIIKCLKRLEEDGAEVTWLPVDEFGLVKVEDLLVALRPQTVLVSIMLANNEIGTIQPIQQLAAAVKTKNPTTIFHTDACQAAGVLDLADLRGVDLISITGTKFGGPHAGALYVRRGVPLKPILEGGGQERGRRSGTEAVADIVGLATAVELARPERVDRFTRMTTWRDQLIHAVSTIPGSHLNGHPTQRLPQNIHFSFEGLSGEMLLVALDQAGVAASTGAACAAGAQIDSHVLTALGLPKTQIRGSLRLTLGWSTTEQEVLQAMQTIPQVIQSLS